MPEALIVRPSLIYGFDPIDKQTAWLVDGIKKANGEVFVDEYRCPIWVDNLAQALLEVAESKLSGILNVAGPQRLNRWEYGLKLLNHLKIDPEGYVVKFYHRKRHQTPRRFDSGHPKGAEGVEDKVVECG